jgi:hypothetical protein
MMTKAKKPISAAVTAIIAISLAAPKPFKKSTRLCKQLPHSSPLNRWMLEGDLNFAGLYGRLQSSAKFYSTFDPAPAFQWPSIPTVCLVRWRRSESGHWAIIAYGKVSIWLTAVKGCLQSWDTEKIDLAEPGRFDRNNNDIDALGSRTTDVDEGALLPILLDPGGAQAGEAVLIDRKLPGQEFVDGQRIAAAGFLEGQQSAADSGHDFRLAANDPSFGTGRGKIRDSKRAAVGPDDVFHPRAMGFGHGVLTNS